MTSGGRFASRWAVIAFLAHTAIVVVASGIHNLLWGKVPFAWEAGHFLRVIDLPVYWAIDHSARQITYLPPWLAVLGVPGTSLLLEGAIHVAIGGAFYAIVAALAALLVQHRRQRQALAAPTSTSTGRASST